MTLRFSLFVTIVLLLHFIPPEKMSAQPQTDLLLSLTGGGTTGNELPFWFHAGNSGRFGQSDSFFGHISMDQSTTADLIANLKLRAGSEFFFRQGTSPDFILNQAWLGVENESFLLYGGRRNEYQGVTYRSLSSGSMGWSDNSAPLPKIGFELKYIDFPLSQGFIQFKGHLAHGWFESDRVTRSPLLHEKSGYVQFSGKLPFRLQAGLVHYALWGGESPGFGQNPASFSDFFKIFTAQSGAGISEVSSEEFALGNHLGFWDFSLQVPLNTIDLIFYKQTPYETDKNLKFKSAQDGLYGAGFQRKKAGSFLDGFLWEFFFSKFQNGPFPPDVVPGKSGRKDYYNHFLYRSGWTYQGRTIGSPLLFPERNGGFANGRRIESTRTVAHHLGVMGTMAEDFTYRAKITYSRNYGTYRNRDIAREAGESYFFENGPEQVSVYFEIRRQLERLNRAQLMLAVSADFGEVYQNQSGLMAGLRWHLSPQ